MQFSQRGFIATFSLISLAVGILFIVVSAYAIISLARDSVDARHERMVARSRAYSCAGYAERLVAQDPYINENYYQGIIYPRYSCKITISFENNKYDVVTVGTSSRAAYRIEEKIEIISGKPRVHEKINKFIDISSSF